MTDYDRFMEFLKHSNIVAEEHDLTSWLSQKTVDISFSNKLEGGISFHFTSDNGKFLRVGALP